MWHKPDPKSAQSVSAQIRASILAAIAERSYGVGEKLPSVRGLATEMLVNPNTVAKVYRELERDGFIETHPGSGVSVTSRARSLATRELHQAIGAAVFDLLEQARRAGLSTLEILSLIESKIGELEETHTRGGKS